VCTVVSQLVKNSTRVGVGDGSNLSVCLADSGVTSVWGNAGRSGVDLFEPVDKPPAAVERRVCHLHTGAAMMSFALLWSQIQGHAPYTRTLEWAAAGNFHLDMGYTIDHLTALMLVIVTTVFLVMVYTDGYMAHDPGYVRFYAYLSLFSSQC